ncbi:hypothetical protein ABBQ38_005993 [Trebouxia sp. C0009 RCD-2024]
MDPGPPRATRKNLLTDEQREFLRTHRVMSNPQLHQLAAQIKVLNRIRDQSKSLHKQQSMQLRPTPWSINLTQDLIRGQARSHPYVAGKEKKKAPRASKSSTPAKRPRPASKAVREAHVAREPAGPASAEESDSAGDDKPARDIELRPRKRVSFNLDEHPFAEEASEDQESDASGSSNGRSRGSGSSASKKRKRQSGNTGAGVADSRGAMIEIEGDEPAQLITMQPVKLLWDENDEACGVCGDDEQAEGNEILLCDGEGCDVAVHQACYAVARVPRGKWYCDACKDKLDLSKPNCVCCPVVGGALRKVPSLGPVKPAEGYCNKKPYLHLACALWTPEILISDPEGMRGPKLDGLRQHRVDLTCAICKQAGGAVIQCSFGVCCRSFHVLCGRHAKGAAAFRHTDGHPLAFCVEHSRERYQRTRQKLVAGDDVLPSASQDLDNIDEAAEAAAAESTVHQPNEYESQRQRNIERNKQMLADLKQKSLAG